MASSVKGGRHHARGNGTSAPTQQRAATEQRGTGDGSSNLTVMASRVKSGRYHAGGSGTSAPKQQRAATEQRAASASAAAISP